MDKQAAVGIIRDTFESPFDKARFVDFIKNLLNRIDENKAFPVIQGHYIPESFRHYIKAYERIGTYTDPANADSKVDILVVYLQKETSLERARTSQRNFVARYLKDRGEKEAGLVAFVSPDPTDWRFSLVKMDYLLEEAPSGKTKVRTELTPARRFSFIVGENESSHTAQSQLVPILQDDTHDPTLKQLEAAFNIEKVTKEFFEKYRELFHNVQEALEDIVKKDQKVRDDFTVKTVSTVDFSKKLLGQIVFLYFLQKKGWFGVGRDKDWGTGPKNFLRLLFDKKNVKYDNFFNDVLESLFYEALATERADDFYSRFICKIPFLNGGLFDPINNYDWVHADILLPNELFSNSQKTKEGDVGTGILNVFDRYNFTVKEDEPLEKEVAIDPEMLGKVFENLLEVKDRKSKGTYYTPREIVHYMCQESLINYLDTAINPGDVPLVATLPPQGKLFGKPDPEHGTLKAPSYRTIVPRQYIEALVRTGDMAIEHDARVECSGRETRDYSYKLPESVRQNASLFDEKLATIRICDPAVGSGAFLVGMMHEIVRARNTLTTYLPDKTGRTNYYFKRHAIQNCLYGVDIDPGAVEIAKLRLWLSLVVDEEDIKQIQPLPNLDYKIVYGDSLLGVEKTLFNLELFEELEKLESFHFDETNVNRKQVYKKQIDQLINQITNNNQSFDFKVYFSRVFREKGGFDVIIANPPYIFSREKLTKNDKIIYKAIYSLTQFKINLYILFIERSFNILSRNGNLAFITPNNWLTLSTASDLRHFLLTNTFDVYVVLNYDKVFENASVDTCILIFRKTGESRINSYKWTEKGIEMLASQYAKFYLEKSGYVLSDLYHTESGDGLRICEKVNAQSSVLSTLADVKNGVQAYTVGEGDPIQTEQMKNNRVYHSTKQKDKTWIKYLDGVDVGRYRLGWSGQFIKYGKNLTRPRKAFLFTGERLLVRQIPGQPPYCIYGCYIMEHAINDNNSMIIKGKRNKVSLKYILGIINSKLITFWFMYTFGKLQRRIFPQFKVKELRTFPIKMIPSTEQGPFVKLVDQILAITKDEDYLTNTAKQAQVKECERQIDQMVYQLYGLTPEEIAVVEGSNKK